MISLNQIVKIKYKEGKKIAVLDHINLQINECEFISVVGFNQCGKSALLKIISMLDDDYYGDYQFENVQVKGLPDDQKRQFRMENVGYLYRNYNLIDYFTIRENISLPLKYLHATKSQSLEKAKYWCHRLKIGHKKNHLSRNVGPLIRIKASIAQCMVLNPKVLLVDDIMNELTGEERKVVINLLSELNNEGLTIILTSEHLNEANLFHRKIFLNEGKIFTDFPLQNGK